MNRFRSLVGSLFALTAFSLPLSIKLYSPVQDLEVIFPAEPLIGSLFMVLAASFLFRSRRLAIDTRYLKHPISLLVAGYLVVSIASTIFSTMPLVSAKALIVRMAYIGVFYYSFSFIPASSKVSASGLIWKYGISFLPIVLFTFANQIRKGFDRAGASHASFPFYTDHTIYAAVLVFILFTFAFSAVAEERTGGSRSDTITLLLVSAIMVLGLYVSFCRAAWVGVFVSLLFLLLVRLGVRYYAMLVVGLSCLTLAVVFSGSLSRANTVDSNADDAGGRESLLSLTNMTTDASNKERLNRWSCAYRMFLDKPILGFGPGTFQFQYIDYQRPGEITYLSVLTPWDPALVTRAWTVSEHIIVRDNPQIIQEGAGTAHSEYLTALSESGLLLPLLLIAFLLVSLRAGLRLLASTSDVRTQCLLLATMAGLLAYFVHGSFNNYLDDCRVASLFWASLSVITTRDLAHRRASPMAR